MSDARSEQATTVHVIVTCANRKSRPIPPELQLGEVGGQSPSKRARRWIGRLAQGDITPKVAAGSLYAGEHWSIARSFPKLHQSHESVHLWTCSAGYGLIPTAAPIMPYHATLTPGQADSVPGDSAEWWSELGKWEGPDPGYPRSIETLVTQDTAAVFMLVLSKNYLRACRADISAAIPRIGNQNRLLIVSAGARPQGDLAPFMVPADARLQSRFGGTRRALNARIGAYLLSKGVRGIDEAIPHMEKLLAEQPPVRRYERERQSDMEILERIAECVTQEPGISANRLLRKFRDSGLACEQHRFTRLFRELAEAKP